MNKKFLYAAMYASVAFASDNQASSTDNTAEQQENNTAMSLARTQNTTGSTKQLQKMFDNSKVVDKQKNNTSRSFARNQKKKDSSAQPLKCMLNKVTTYTNLTSVSFTQNTPGDAQHIEHENTSVPQLSKTTAEKDRTASTVSPGRSQEEDASAEDLPEHTQSVQSAEDVKDDSTLHDTDVQCENTATAQYEEIRAIIEQCVRKQLKAIQRDLTKNATEGSEEPSARSVFLDTVDKLWIDASSEKVAYSILAKLQEHTTRQYNDTATAEPTEARIEEPYTEEDLSATTKDDELRQKTSALTEIETEIAATNEEIESKNQELLAIQARLADKEGQIAATNEEIACKDQELHETQKILANKERELKEKKGELPTITKEINKAIKKAKQLKKYVSDITALSDKMEKLQELMNAIMSQITSAIYTHSPVQYIIAHIQNSISHSDLTSWCQSSEADKDAIVREAYKHAEKNYAAQISKLFGDKINAKMFALGEAETLKDATRIVIEKSGINELLKELNISRHDNNQTYDANKYMEEIIPSLNACQTKISELQQYVENFAHQYKEDQQTAVPDEEEEMLNKIAQNNPDLLVKVLNEHTAVLEQYLEAQLGRYNSEDAQKLLGLICGKMINLAQVGIESEKKPHDE